MKMVFSDQIKAYIHCLKTFNEHTNVYSRSAYDKLPFHVRDSILMANLVENRTQLVADFGSGSGLPSVVIAIQNPLNQVVAIESTLRKQRFLIWVKESLGLSNFAVYQGDVARFIREKGVVSVVTAKAFASREVVHNYASRLSRPVKIIIPISANQANAYPDHLRNTALTVVQEDSGTYYYDIVTV